MLIRELMKPVEVLAPETPISEAAKLMKEADVELIPVGRGEDLQGVVTPREIAVAAAEPCNAAAMPVDEVATNVLGFCCEDQDVQEALRTMQSTRQTRLLVRGRDGRTIGVIAIADILGACPDIEINSN
jgi:CBS domain-containing protein